MPQSIRTTARMLMPGWIMSGLSAARVTENLIHFFGKAYHRSTLLEDYREFKGLIVNEARIKALRGETIIPRNMMSETVLRLPRRYLVAAKATFTDPLTGETIERHISWYTNTLGSKEGMIAEYTDTLAPRKYETSELPKSVEIRSIRHHVNMDY